MVRLRTVLEKYGIILVTLVSGVIYCLCLHNTVAGHDESVYIMLARSLATGKGFRDLYLPGEPPSTLRPFGYPLLLVPATVLFPAFPENVIPLKLATVFWGVANVLLMYWLFRSWKAKIWLATLLAGVIAMAPLTINFATSTLSEVSYMFFSLLVLLLLDRWERSGRVISVAWLVSILAMAMTYFTRVAGLSLFVAVVSYLLLRKRWKSLLLTGGLFVSLIAPWVYRNAVVGSSALTADYVQSFFVLKDMQRPYLGTIGLVDLVVRLLNNVWGHATESILWLLFPWAINGWWPAFLSRVHIEGLTWAPTALGLAVSALCVSGYVVSLRERLRVDHLYVVFYLGIVLLPPWYVERNLWPLLPFLLYYFALGVRWLVERVSLLWCRAVSLTGPVTVVVFCIFLLGFGMGDRHLLVAGAAYRAGEVGEPERLFGQTCKWIGDNTSPDDLILYRYPEKLYLYTERKSVDIPMVIDRKAFVSRLAEMGVDYAILEPSRTDDLYEYSLLDQIYLQPAVEAYPQSFAPVCQIGGSPGYPVVMLYRLENVYR